MTRSAKQFVLALYFLGGVLLGLYLGAVIQEGHAQSPEVAAALANASEHYGVSESWLRRITWCESRWTPWVTSRGGHMGIAQFSGPTWRWMSSQAGWQGPVRTIHGPPSTSWRGRWRMAMRVTGPVEMRDTAPWRRLWWWLVDWRATWQAHRNRGLQAALRQNGGDSRLWACR